MTAASDVSSRKVRTRAFGSSSLTRLCWSHGAHGEVLRGPDRPSQEIRLPWRRLRCRDHIPPFALDERLVREKLWIVEGAGLIAEAIRRLHEGRSLVELLEGA